MKTLHNYIKLLLTIAIVISFSFVSAQSDFDEIDFSGLDSKGLFGSDELLQLTITADFDAISKDVAEETSYHKGEMTYTDLNNELHSIAIKLRTRGHFRKNPCNCEFPPLKVKFNKGDSKNTDFEGQSTLKLVTHCNNKKDVFEQYIIQEYLVYKAYNIITNKSFRVRLAQITYIDINDAFDPMVKYAFFIENTSVLSARLGGSELEVKNVHNERTEVETMTTLAVFQYMIGNTDWSVPKLHNVKLVSTNITLPPYAVAYDFDWSGMVNSHYAEPAQHLDLLSVRDRAYRGFYRTPEQIAEVTDLFLSKKQELYNLYNNCEYLSEKQKKQSVNYLDSFFKVVEREKAAYNVFVRGARSSDYSLK